MAAAVINRNLGTTNLGMMNSIASVDVVLVVGTTDKKEEECGRVVGPIHVGLF